MGTSILNIGVTGLNAAQAGLLTTGHNIANAATPGYNRQQIVQSTNTPQFTGAGFFGQGTNVSNVQRIYSQFLAAQVTTASTQAAQYQTYSSEISQLDNLLADANAGLSPAVQDFFNAVSDVSANPASIPARQAMLSSAQALAGRFQSVDSRLNEIREGVNGQITSSVGAINSLAQQVADLNQRIVVAQAAGPAHQANDLFDQRDQLIAELNQQIRVTTSSNDDGSLNVFVGNGQALVVGMQTSKLTVTPSAGDMTRLEVGLQGATGALIRMPESLITGGALGGLVAFRRETLEPAINSVGRVAIGFAQTFNDQHQLGQDLTGAMGGDMFNVASPLVLAATQNSGTANIAATLGNVADLTGSDYRLAYDGANYTLTRVSDNKSWTAASSSALPPASESQGFTLNLTSGTPSAGDTFLIQPTREGAKLISVLIGDARNVAAAAPLRTVAATSNTGTGSISAGSVNSPPPTNANLQQTVSITFNNPPTSFNVSGTGTGDPVNVTFAAGADISYNGWTVQIAGSPAAGDTFKLQANTSGVSDNRNALLLGQLQSAQTLLGGTASYQSAYSQIVSTVGNKAREVEVGLTAQQNLVQQAQDAQQSLSGVNLDEEAANLLRYQQLFQASGKMIDIAGKLFDQILALGS